MSTRMAAGVVAILWLAGVGTPEAHAQGTVDFAANNPVWTGAPGRKVDATMNYTTNAGFTTDSLKITVTRSRSLVACGRKRPPISEERQPRRHWRRLAILPSGRASLWQEPTASRSV